MAWIKQNRFTLLIIGTVLILLGLITTIILIQKHEQEDERSQYESSISHTPILGDKGAEDTISIYADFQCPYCKEFDLKMMDKLKSRYVDSGKANIRFVNVGLLGDESLYKSVLSYSLYEHAPDKYWTFNQRLFEEQPKEKQHITKNEDGLTVKNTKQKATDNIVEHAKDKNDVNRLLKDIGVSQADIKVIHQDVSNSKSKAWKNALKDRNLAKKHEIKDVPTIFINGERIKNPNVMESYKDKLG